jgi:diguanylate cyclase (GGDEF)-like protein
VRDATGTVVDFEYTEANQEACRHNHMSRERLIGSRLLSLFPGHRGELLARFALVLDSGEPLVLDDHPYPTDGDLRWFDNRAVKVADDLLSFTWRDVTEAHLLREALTQRATTDPLTGLLNRAGLEDAVRRLTGPERRSRDGVAVFYVDLDGLTQINNTHGHPAGDQVLRAVADRMAGVLRADDVVARVGGDEFVVLAPGTDDEAAGQLAIKIAHAITRPVRTATTSLLPTVSIGAAVGGPDADLEQLVAQADAALLKQKLALYQP